MKTSRIALFFAVAGVLSIALFGSLTHVLVTQEKLQEERSDTISAVLFVQGQEYKLAVPRGSTVHDFMDTASTTLGLRFQGRDFGGIGFFVEEINGIFQDQSQKMYWIYSINGQKSQVGVSQYRLQAGDIISWSYEKLY